MTNSGNHKLGAPPGDNLPGGLFIMDLDGTLLRSDRSFAGPDLEALRMLGNLNVVRTIATGRSLASFDTVIVSDLPVDYLIFFNGSRGSEIPKP